MSKSPATAKTALALALLTLTLGLASALVYGSRDIELPFTDHYARDFPYGGYSNFALRDSGGNWSTFHLEGLPNYLNTYSMLDRSARPKFDGSYIIAFDRVGSSFMTAILAKLSFGAVPVLKLFPLLNAALWLASVLCLYGLTLHWFGCRLTAVLAAGLFALYPGFGITLNSFKAQMLGTPFLLISAYFYEVKLSARSWTVQATALALLGFIGQYASGGFLYFLLYLAGRFVGSASTRFPFYFSAPSVVAGSMAARFMSSSLGFFSMLEKLRFGPQLRNAGRFLLAAVTLRDLGNYRFLNFPGTTFFSKEIPWVLGGYLLTNPFLILAAAAGFAKLRQTRFLGPVAAALLLCHLPIFFVGAVYSYGYSSAPTFAFLSISAAVWLQSAVDSPAKRARWMAIGAWAGALLTYSTDLFPNVRYQLNLYVFTSWEFIPFLKKVYVFHS